MFLYIYIYMYIYTDENIDLFFIYLYIYIKRSPATSLRSSRDDLVFAPPGDTAQTGAPAGERERLSLRSSRSLLVKKNKKTKNVDSLFI